MKRLHVEKRDIIVAVATVLAMGGITMSAIALMNTRPRVPYSEKGITISWLAPTVTRWRSTIESDAKKYNIDANLVAVIMTLESGGYTKADSGEAVGLMQITPATGGDIATKFLKETQSDYDLMNPKTSIEFGTAYLAYLRDEFCDSTTGPDWACVELIAAGYNGGPGAANKVFTSKGLTDTETVVYARDAFNMYREGKSSKSPTYERWLERGGSDLVDKAKKEES
jgi:hypothetical protein